MQGQGEQTDAAHHEALHGDLEGVEGPGHGGELEEDLHGGKDNGGQGDVKAAEDSAAVHTGSSPLEMLRISINYLGEIARGGFEAKR